MPVRQRTVSIRQFIIQMVRHHPADIAAVVGEKFGISRQAANRHLQELCDSKVLSSTGRTSSRRYELRPLAEVSLELPVSEALEEDVPWTQEIRPKLNNVPQNVVDICAYGFTEMLNNVIDHSESPAVSLDVLYTAESVSISIVDRGVGIFKKIKKAINLNDEREAILELAKGKLTTDPARHTGEGIFFTSRMVDLFYIWSGNLCFTHIRPDSDWLIEVDREEVEGTTIQMVVALKSTLSPKDLFDEYASGEDLTFSKTHVPIRLAQYGSDNLLSRSQAKRVLNRFTRFAEVFLDFNGVEFIGQAFADEIFRVFQTAHPTVKLVAINANPAVSGMIRRALDVKHERQMRLFDPHDDVAK
jgi:anti-sigma regulatory factor (Ser/Thr protein kinase)